MDSEALKIWMRRAGIGLLIAWMLGLMAVQVILEDPYIQKTRFGSPLHAQLLAIFSRRGERCR